MTMIRCPLLGTSEDRETTLAFPSPWNCCYKSGKPGKIALDHQTSFCLGEGHESCPVFSGVYIDAKRVNSHKAAQSKTNYKKNGEIPKVWYQVFLGVLGLFILVVVIGTSLWFFSENGKAYSDPRKATSSQLTAMEQMTPEAVKPSATPYTPLSNSSKTTQIPVIAAQPTQTNTTGQPEKKPTAQNAVPVEIVPMSTPANTYICIVPTGWVPYVVQPGDTLFSLSQSVKRSVPQLQSANCLGSSSLVYSGKLLYLPFIPARTATKPPQNMVIPPTETSIPALPPTAEITPVPQGIVPQPADSPTPVTVQ